MALEALEAQPQQEPQPRPRPKRPRRPRRVAALAVAAAVATGVGFGATTLVAGGSPGVSSVIPSPATGPSAFQEDDNLTGQDNQTNIFQATAPGVVHILSGGQPVGTGLVLTPSGKVLTTYRPARGARDLAAKYVQSGIAFRTAAAR